MAQEVSSPLIVCRVYASIADLLGFMAGEGGIRAGPAANVAWRCAFALLEVCIYLFHWPNARHWWVWWVWCGGCVCVMWWVWCGVVGVQLREEGGMHVHEYYS